MAKAVELAGILLVMYVTAVQATPEELINTVWTKLEGVDTRFGQYLMHDPFLIHYVTTFEKPLFDERMTPENISLANAHGLDFYVLHFDKNWDESAVHEKLKSSLRLDDHSLETIIGIEITATERTIESMYGQANDQIEYKLLIGISKAVTTVDSKIMSELEARFGIKKLDHELQVLANVYATKGANSGKRRNTEETIEMQGFEIRLVQTLPKESYAVELDRIAKESSTDLKIQKALEGKEVCAVGCDEGRMVNEALGINRNSILKIESTKLLYITIVLRRTAEATISPLLPNDALPLSDMSFTKSLTINREFLNTLFNPGTQYTTNRRLELESLLSDALGSKGIKRSVKFDLEAQNVAINAFHERKDKVNPNYVTSSTTFATEVTIREAIHAHYAQTSNESSTLYPGTYYLTEMMKYLCKTQACPKLPASDNTAPIAFGIFWDSIPAEEKFKLTIATSA